jgi:hypothetical protein
MRNAKLYKDLLHGFHARCSNKVEAWGLIRGKCHDEGLEVPTLDMIVEIK